MACGVATPVFDDELVSIKHLDRMHMKCDSSCGSHDQASLENSNAWLHTSVCMHVPPPIKRTICTKARLKLQLSKGAHKNAVLLLGGLKLVPACAKCLHST